ncbi:MAG TPA: AGE family epimerase/isomerase [Spirochaetia bacterium]|nr:AGE family epimerase/isomerase [Spirochaetia bacterium]
MELADRIEKYLVEKLYPFWYQRVAAPDGGFTTYFDRNGKPTGQTDKTLIQQTRSIFMLSHAIRNGYAAGQAERLLKPGLEWFLRTFRDREHDGWFWIVDKAGVPVSTDKIMYGQSFVMYCMSECALATGNAAAREVAEHTFDLVQKYAADTAFGGYREMFLRDWQPRPSGAYGGDRKSFDVHMHLMEAYTTLYELTRADVHRRKLLEVIQVLWSRMFHTPTWTGVAQFALDFTPLPAIMFKTVWGSDRDNEGQPRPLNNTSYGHNIEFLWLFLHALDILGESVEPWREKLAALARHTITYGVDSTYGGVYVEGPHDGPARDQQKEFWQQAEALVGLLDSYLLFREKPYADAFHRVFDFAWGRMINHEVGEWFALLDRNGTVKWDYLGHAWKNNYHTTRSMVQTLRRLKKIEQAGLPL